MLYGLLALAQVSSVSLICRAGLVGRDCATCNGVSWRTALNEAFNGGTPGINGTGLLALRLGIYNIWHVLRSNHRYSGVHHLRLLFAVVYDFKSFTMCMRALHGQQKTLVLRCA